MKNFPSYSYKKRIVAFRRENMLLSQQPWFQGVLLLGCVVVAMLLANLPGIKDIYHHILETTIQLHLASPDSSIDLSFPKEMTIEKFINDILMVVFFFTVGLEIKREIAYGELSSPKKAMMPIIAAFGGVAAPALIFTLINHGTAASTGWGIPTATDIAFAVCILSVLGNKVPVSLKVFLTALAIADDLIAILVVAIFYGGTINLPLIGIAFLVIMFVVLLGKLGEKRVWPYLSCAVLVWILFYYSGIHATMSGVVMAFLIPTTARYGKEQLRSQGTRLSLKVLALDNEVSDEEGGFPSPAQKKYLRKLSRVSHESMDMSSRVEHLLTPWVNYLIMPVFALANAGVTISDPGYFNIFSPTIAGHPEMGMVGLGIFMGLLLGKPVGITLMSWIAIKFKFGEMPAKATWPMFFAVACIGGIGFTMSIFVDTLSFGNNSPEIMNAMRDAGKIAVLLGSIAAGVLGSILVNIVYKAEHKAAKK